MGGGYRLVLGSSSRWRRIVLDRTGLPYTVEVAAIDEDAITIDGTPLSARPTSDPAVLSLTIARAKADAVLPRVSNVRPCREPPHPTPPTHPLTHPPTPSPRGGHPADRGVKAGAGGRGRRRRC